MKEERSSPPLRSSDEELTQHPALIVFIVSDCVVQFMADSNLQTRGKRSKRLRRWDHSLPPQGRNSIKVTGSTVGMFEVRLLFLPGADAMEVWLSSKSPPLTLLEGDEARFLFKAIEIP